MFTDTERGVRAHVVLGKEYQRGRRAKRPTIVESRSVQRGRASEQAAIPNGADASPHFLAFSLYPS